jgi:hypothetical protein
VIVLKKFFVLFVIFLCGCSSKSQLNCNYVDSSSIFGNKSVNDIIFFKNDRIISYRRGIVFNLHSGIADSSSVYKIVKMEGKALKKYIGGRYEISKSSNEVSFVFNSKKINNLNYIGIDSNYGYDEVRAVYNELGFECK